MDLSLRDHRLPTSKVIKTRFGIHQRNGGRGYRLAEEIKLKQEE